MEHQPNKINSAVATFWGGVKSNERPQAMITMIWYEDRENLFDINNINADYDEEDAWHYKNESDDQEENGNVLHYINAADDDDAALQGWQL